MAKDEDNTIYTLLAEADDTYARIPPNLRVAVDKITRGLPEFGPRKLRRAGVGTEFFEARPFRPGVDNGMPNAKLSARAGRPIIVENEAETRQHFYLWRDATPSTQYKSRKDLFTIKETEEIMLLALAKHLARNEELIGLLDRDGEYRGGHAPEIIAPQLAVEDDVTIATGGMPTILRPLPRNSTVVLFSDFLMDTDELADHLDQITGIGLNGYLVMVLDPAEIEFKGFKGHMEFNGMEGEGKIAFKEAGSLRKAYMQEIQQRIELVQNLAEAKGFKFILQRTDEPLENGLLAVYGVLPASSSARPSPGL